MSTDEKNLRPADPKPAPICKVCKDSHVMPATGWSCTHCPTPCNRPTCRKSAVSAYCDVTPCACVCHAEHHQYKGRAPEFEVKPKPPTLPEHARAFADGDDLALDHMKLAVPPGVEMVAACAVCGSTDGDELAEIERCHVEPGSSRTCPYGTRACVADHAPREPEAVDGDPPCPRHEAPTVDIDTERVSEWMAAKGYGEYQDDPPALVESMRAGLVALLAEARADERRRASAFPSDGLVEAIRDAVEGLDTVSESPKHFARTAAIAVSMVRGGLVAALAERGIEHLRSKAGPREQAQPEPDWRAWYTACAEAAGIMYEADGVASQPGPVEAVVLAIRALRDEVRDYTDRRIPRERASWHEDDGAVMWWRFPVSEPPYVGTALDDDFPEYVTHWTPMPRLPFEVPT